MSQRIVKLEEELVLLKLRHERLVVTAKGRRKAIKDMNRFVKYMRKNDNLLTVENESLRAQVDRLSRANLALLKELEEAKPVQLIGI